MDDFASAPAATSYKRRTTTKDDDSTVADEREFLNTACALLNAPMKDNNKCDENVTAKRTEKVDTEMDVDELFNKMLTTQL